MDDKVIFPGTWSESLVKRWKRQFLDAFLKDSNVPLTLSEGCWSTPVAPLRKLYIENRDSFVKLTQLFRLFGIEVHVKNGQGLFGDWQWNTSWQVVVSASAVQNWQILNDMVTHSPILRTIPFLRELVSEQRLEGLVIDQLKSFNALMDVQQLHKDFSRMGIEIEYVQALAPGSILLTNEDSKKNKHINKAQTLVDVFGEKNTWLINRFKEFDMTKLDDVTIGKLGLVFQSKGIGPGKINKIQQLLIQSGMSESEVSFGYTKEKDSSLENNTPYVLSVLKASDLAKVTPRGLSSLRDGHVRGAWLVQDVLKYFSEMATNIPDWEVYSSILPMGKKLYESMTDKHAPNVMSLRLYVLLLGCVWTLKKRQREKFEPIVSRGSHLDEVGSWNLVVNDEFNQDAAKKIISTLKLKIGSEFEQTRWNQSLFVLDLLIPDSIGDMVEDYWNGVDDRLREIVFAREVQQPTSTLQELAVGYGLTRERIRQMESQAIHEYYDWWDNLNLSLKLLISDKQEHIQLDSLYTPLQAQLIMRLIVKKKHPELGQWVYTADSLFSKFKMSLKQVVMDKRWIKNSDIRDSMNADCSIFTQADLEKGMHSLGFHFVQDVSVWTQNKGLTMTELIQQYMSQFNLKVINADEQSFERIDSWSKHYFNRKIATSMRAFKAGLGKNTNLLPVGNGAFRAYQADRYPQPLLHLTKNKLDKRFEEGYLFARDAWLLDTVKVQLADDMTKDEWYQAFKREYSAEYSFGTGRNNDVYPLSQKQLTINQQIELVARQNLKGYSLFQLKQDYGWEPYSVQQATSVTPSIYLHHNQLFWVNVVEADKIIKTAMSEYFEQTFKTTELTTMQKAYDFFNEFMLDQDPKAFDEMQIYNVEALSSYLSSFSEIDIVGNFFIIDSNGLPDLPRESRKVWAEYLQRIACKPLTEYQIFEAVNADGTTRSTWDQGHELKMKDARIVPISKDLFVASRNILRTDELDSLVHRSMSSLLDKKAFVATQTLSDDVYTSLPDAHNREFPDQIFSWTPELFISYAEKLGYLRLSWPKSMIRGNCDVLVPKTSSFNSMEALMASLIIEWMKSETNENNLFVHAASLGLVPKRVDEYKQRFSRLFMNDQGFTVDGLGNVKRQKK